MADGFDRQALADRSGLDAESVDHLLELGILAPSSAPLFSESDLRRAIIIRGLEQAGFPLEDLAREVREGRLSLDFVDEPGFHIFADLSGQTFAELARETGIPLGLLSVLREATGFAQPEPGDAVRSDELKVVTLVRAMLDAGVPEAAVERTLRTYGDSARRIAETESAWFQEYLLGPFFESGKDWSQMSEVIGVPARALSAASDPAVLAMLHAQQSHTWLQGIFDRFMEHVPADRRSAERQPAICFLDLTGYTRLTEEHGDRAAADVAGSLARLVQRSAQSHGGRPVKWLGDGVMFHFRAPGPAVVAALEMVEGSSSAGLPPAHVGIHAGPVLFQEGDYFGRTVNAASRIADYARPGEVLVTREVADVTDTSVVAFRTIGAVDLKGFSASLFLLSASRSGPAREADP